MPLFIKKISPYVPISLIIVVSLSFRLWYLFHPSAAWWDAGIYIGMGKYLFSNGQSGLWETFRPPVWPIILGTLWKINLDPNLWSKGIEILASCSSIALVYTVGEKIKKNTGVFAALFFSFNPIFFSFTAIPLTDIPGTFISLLAVYFLLEEYYVVAGVCSAVSFGIRFPLALIIIPFTLYTLFHTASFKANVQKSLVLITSFSIPVIVYFIINTIIYHDPLLPINLARKAALSSELYTLDSLFYIKNIFKENWFMFFSFIPILSNLFFYIYYKKYIHGPIPTTSSVQNILTTNYRSTVSIISVTSVCFIVLLSYFSLLAHKEPRYAIVFIPYVCILSGYGLVILIDMLYSVTSKLIMYYTCILLVCFVVIPNTIHASKTYLPRPASVIEYQKYYNFFGDKSTVTIITSSPQIALFSDARIVEISDTWKDVRDAYARRSGIIGHADYLALDTCQIKTSDLEQQKIMALLSIKTKLVFSTTTATSAGICQLVIYRL